jgi:hypothetical protein
MNILLGHGAGSHSHETNGRREAGENLIGAEGIMAVFHWRGI